MVMISRKKLNKNLEKETLKNLLREVKNIRSENDLEIFLNKFFTRDEKEILLRRLAIANFLIGGKKYREIKDMLEVSRDTISAVKDILLGYGYDKRDKKRKYSVMPEYRNKRQGGFLSKFPTKTGKGRWRFLDSY